MPKFNWNICYEKRLLWIVKEYNPILRILEALKWNIDQLIKTYKHRAVNKII